MSFIFKSKILLYVSLVILLLIIIIVFFLIIDNYSQNAFTNRIITSDYSFYIIKTLDRTIYEKEENHSNEMRLRIPEIEIDTPVLIDVDVTNANNISEKPVHYQMSDYPSLEGGNVAIAGHRTIKVFLFLDRLSEGDLIYIDYLNNTFTYIVKETFYTEGDDWSVIETTKKPTVTLTTCDRPVGEPEERLIVKGVLRESD